MKKSQGPSFVTLRNGSAQFFPSTNGALNLTQMLAGKTPVLPPKPKNLDELADYLEQFLPASKLPAKLLRLMHREKCVSFARIEDEVYGQHVEDIMYVLKRARLFIAEHRLPFRIEQRGIEVVRVDISE